MFCPKCGIEIAPGQNFCIKCGTPVTAGMREASSCNTSPTTQPNTGSPSPAQRDTQFIDELTGYFSTVLHIYNRFDAVSHKIKKLCEVTARSALVWSIILLSFFSFFFLLCLSSEGFSDWSFDDIIAMSWLIFMPGLIGAGLMILFICLNRRRKSKLPSLVAQYYELSAELTRHYYSCKGCPIPSEYTNPMNLQLLKSYIVLGRVRDIKDALCLIDQDAYYKSKRRLSVEVSRAAAEIMRESDMPVDSTYNILNFTIGN